MWEAFAATGRVALEGALAWSLAAAVLRAGSGRRLALPLAGALAAGLLAGVAALAIARARGLSPNEVAPPLLRAAHVIAVVLLAGAVLLRRRTMESLLDPVAARAATEAALLAGGVALLLPEGAFLAARLEDAAVLAGASLPVAAGAAFGALAAAAAGPLLARAWGRWGIAAALTPSTVLALAFAAKIVGVAAAAVDAHTLPAALGGAVGRAVHDAVHLAFVQLQVPDHPYLEERVYQAILVVLDPSFHDALAALAVIAPLGVALAAFLRRVPPALAAGARDPERRLARAAFRRRSRAVGAAFGVAAALSAASVVAARARGDELYDPVPEPVVDDGAGTVIVPLGGPLAGGDDRMRKWVHAAGGRAITFFTVRRPDGSLVAALDLCEICQPKGYAQMGPGYVFCKYCKAPIPVDTVGQPGGCNPVPIPGAIVRGAALLVPRDRLVAAWEKAMADKR